MSSFSHSIQPGHVFRHAQKPDGIPVEIAVLDIAQDFLLTHLHNEGFFDEFVHFKGGTCLRKFSLDEIEQQLFSLYGFLRDLTDEQETIASANEGDRSLIIQKVEALNDRGFTSEDFW